MRLVTVIGIAYHEVRENFLQELPRYGTLTEDEAFGADHSNDGALETEDAGAGIDHGYAVAKILLHVLCTRRAWTSTDIGTGSRQGTTGQPKDLECDRMRGHAYGHGVESSRNNVRYDRTAPEHKSQRPGPEHLSQAFKNRMVGHVSELACLIHRCDMDDQRIISRTPLEVIDPRYGLRSINTTCQTIYRLGRNGHDLSVAKKLCGALD